MKVMMSSSLFLFAGFRFLCFCSYVLVLFSTSICRLNLSGCTTSALALQLQIKHDHVVMDNDIVQVTLSKPTGVVMEIKYNGSDNLLEVRNEFDNRGYWDLNWSEPESLEKYYSICTESGTLVTDYSNVQTKNPRPPPPPPQDQNQTLPPHPQEHDLGYWTAYAPAGVCPPMSRIMGTNFKVIKKDENQVELSFVTTWNPSHKGKVSPLNVDKRFIMLRNSSGFYTYAIYEYLEGWPDFDLTQTRVVFKLRKDKFHYMAMSDDRQGIMPMPEDRITGQPLAYPEAVLLTNPTNPDLKGQVDDKYQYSCENQYNRVHGWISSNPTTAVGFWIITPSDEFRTGGPVKQDLTAHVGPTALAMFVSRHYAGESLDLKFRNGAAWKKVFGPVFIYLNSVLSDSKEPYAAHWEDAKQQMKIEVQKWPYDFPVSEDFLGSDLRGTVNGRLLVQIRYGDEEHAWPADSAYVGCAPPGELGSWQRESKGYQFWTKSNVNGSFSVSNIRPGEYNFFAWIPGFIGDYKYSDNLTINPGSVINLGDLVYEPPSDGPKIWEIGIPDRSAAEFYIPEPNPKYINKLVDENHQNCNCKNSTSINKYRQYGLWERYTDLYPEGDLIYTVGVSDYKKDWFFAQVNRVKKDGTFQATTWQIKFDLENLEEHRTYKLRLALASAKDAELQVRFNDEKVFPPHFTTGTIGNESVIMRHGIHGLYWLYNIDVSSSRLVRGTNTIFLTQSRSSDPFQGIMYDYICLECPLASKYS